MTTGMYNVHSLSIQVYLFTAVRGCRSWKNNCELSCKNCGMLSFYTHILVLFP